MGTEHNEPFSRVSVYSVAKQAHVLGNLSDMYFVFAFEFGEFAPGLDTFDRLRLGDGGDFEGLLVVGVQRTARRPGVVGRHDSRAT